jgi:DNA-binding CsgD family transcriptional regulator
VTEHLNIAVADVVWREDLYPRIKTDPALVQRYAQDLDVMPPIEVNQDMILIDGWHRWTAHRKTEAESIKATITETQSDLEIRLLAIKRNAEHGWQLDEPSKKHEAILLYAAGTGIDKREIADALSVSLRSVNGYLTDIDRKLREERKQTILDMWLACHTQQEIADEVDISVGSVNAETDSFFNFGSTSNSEKSLAFFQDADFKPPIYNVWTFAKKTNTTAHFGNSEQQILENLLYLYTEPFDIVFDPFGGGGATIDVCKRRLRRYWVSDRKPIPERENEIRQMNVAQELPSLRWSDVTLTYLDPPYWRQAQGKYSDDAEDLANMSLADFTKAMGDIIKAIARKQTSGVIAMLMQPTQWNADDRQFTDHITDIVRAVNTKNLVLENRVSCPYSTEQYNAQQVNWAKEHRQLLVLSRELVIWRVVS